jgi:cytochrome c peroxidase
MKAIKVTIGSLVILAGATLYSCQQEEIHSGQVVLELPTVPYDYRGVDNDNLATLGRVLFYDPRLSVNNSVSCSSCHKQALAFADRADFSLGFENKLTGRNSMPIQNIVSDVLFGAPDPIDLGGGIIFEPGFQPPTSLFWDGRQKSLQTMVMEPIKNHIEMGTSNLDLLADKLSQIDDYQELFYKSNSTYQVTPENIASALSAFLVSIRSDHSKFDKSIRGESEPLTILEDEGKHLFFEKYNCNSCHQLQQPFNGYQFAGNGGFTDIGLDQQPVDGGVFKVSGVESDRGRFKIPSLRNIELTAPYMHDGRFETLEEVLDHYSEGIKNSENLDPILRDQGGSAMQFHIPASEKQAIIAFLHTMTDYQMISDPMFSSPFKLK